MGFKKQTPDYIATCEVDRLLAQYVTIWKYIWKLNIFLDMAE